MTDAALRPPFLAPLASLIDALVASFGPVDPPRDPVPASTAERLGVARWDAYDPPAYRRRGRVIPGLPPAA